MLTFSPNTWFQKVWTRSLQTKRLTSRQQAVAFVEDPHKDAPVTKRAEPYSPLLHRHQLQPVPVRKVMSYNAENFIKTNAGRDVKPAISVQALAQAIQAEMPDVIALQEVGDEKLLSQFNMKYLNGTYPNIVSHVIPESGTLQVALMSRTGVNVVDSKSHWDEMRQAYYGAGKRDLLEATFQTETGYRFTVFNTHFKSMFKGEAKTALARQQQAKVAADILKRFLATNPKAHVLLTGDFNTLHNSPLGKPVIDTLMYWDNPASGKKMTEIFLKQGQPQPTHHASERYPSQKLDYSFVSKDMEPHVKMAYVAGDFAKSPWKEASDHLPVVTTFAESPPARQADSAAQWNWIVPFPRPGKRKFDLIA